MDWAISISDIIVSLSVVGVGIFCKQYLIKSADFKHAEENIDKLVMQLEKTTSVTKSIEAKLNNDAWVGQQRWLIRKEFYLEAVSLLTSIDLLWADLIADRMADESRKMDDTSFQELTEDESSKRNRLTKIVDEVGVLFLEEHVIKTIYIFLAAEHTRQKPLREMFKGQLTADEKNEIHGEISDNVLFISTQKESCKKARLELIKVAKLDLNIAWKK